MHELVTVPDDRLTTVCTPAHIQEDVYIEMFCKELIDYIESNKNCAGLGANQLGVTSRIFGIKHKGKAEIFINPEVELFGETVESPESCLSIPNESYLMKRRTGVTVKYTTYKNDRFFQTSGKFTLGKNDNRAIIIQHENDHINGILISSGERIERD